MQFVDTIFWLYGEERRFPIRLQRCSCTAEISGQLRQLSDPARKMD